MIVIYNKENLNIVEKLNYTKEEFDSEPTKFYPLWDSETMIYNDKVLKYPKIVDGVLVEKSTEELKIEGILPLRDGEYIENNVLIVVPYTDDFYKPIWVAPSWIEGATDEEIKIIYIEQIRGLRTPKMNAYDKLATNKAVGVDVIEESEWEMIKEWRQIWLDLPETVEITKNLEEQIPSTPSRIQYYEGV